MTSIWRALIEDAMHAQVLLGGNLHNKAFTAKKINFTLDI
jgi:hypothetical protein